MKGCKHRPQQIVKTSETVIWIVTNMGQTNIPSRTWSKIQTKSYYFNIFINLLKDRSAFLFYFNLEQKFTAGYYSSEKLFRWCHFSKKNEDASSKGWVESAPPGWNRVVYDRNLVSVSATETKIKSRYRFRGQNFFCLNLNFPPF